MIEKIVDLLIERRIKQKHIHVTGNSPSSEFKRVLNTLRSNKIMVKTKGDGIYIRMAGDVSKGECFSEEFVRVKKFDDEIA